jgi:hypothetical protein
MKIRTAKPGTPDLSGPCAQELSSFKGASPIKSTPEWLTRHRSVAYAALALIPFLTTLPLWICHLSIDPIWFFSGIVQGVKPGIVPNGLPFGDPNIGWTTQALGRLAASQWAHGQVPWWNPYSGIGLPLAGEMQPGAFFLPFIFLLLLRNGWLWLRIAMQLVAGFSTFALCRELKLGPLASLVAGILFQLNGTFAFTPGPASVFCAAAFLPLLLLGIEQISKPEKQRTGTLWFALAIGFSTLAGFPEVAYIDGLLALAWALGRFALLQNRWRFASRILYSGLLGLALASPQLVSFLPLLADSTSLGLHKLGAVTISTIAIPSIFVPFIFGPYPSAFGDIGRWNIWGTESYAGILLFFFAIVGLQSSRRPWMLRLLLPLWITFCFLKTFGPASFVTLVNHIPFLAQTVFVRYSPPSWLFAFILLTGFGIEELRHYRPRLWPATVATVILLFLCIHIAWPWHPHWGLTPPETATLSRYMVYALGGALAGLVICALLLVGSRAEWSRALIAAIVSLNAAVLFIIPMLSGVHPGKVDQPALTFLRKNLGLSRLYTLEPMQPNYSAFFKLYDLNYDSFPVPKNFGEYVAHNLFPPIVQSGYAIFWPAMSWYESRFGFNDLYTFLTNYEALGVKYVLSRAGTAEQLLPEAEVPIAPGAADPMVLKPGEQARFTLRVPANPAGRDNYIRAIAVSIGTYGNRSDGDLAIQACAGQNCSAGSRPLSESSDNTFFYLPLQRPLTIPARTIISAKLIHAGGHNAVAIWLFPGAPDQEEQVWGPDGNPLPGKSVRAVLSYGAETSAARKIYRDSVTEIFELPNPAPYFELIRGGPCRLDASDHDSLHAACSAPASVIRRELYLPGWHLTVGDRRKDVKPYGQLFQQFELPPGDVRVHFAYAPPGAWIAWCLCFLAVAALTAEITLHRRSNHVTKVTSPPIESAGTL